MNKLNFDCYQELGLDNIAHTVLLAGDDVKFVNHLYGREIGAYDSREFDFFKPSFMKVDFTLKDLIYIWLAQKTLARFSSVTDEEFGMNGIEITMMDSQYTLNKMSVKLFDRELLGSPVIYVLSGLVELQFHDTEHYGPGAAYALNLSRELNESIRDNCREHPNFREFLSDLTSTVFGNFMEDQEYHEQTEN